LYYHSILLIEMTWEKYFHLKNAKFIKTKKCQLNLVVNIFYVTLLQL
jgi:hypothetical protein